MNTKPQSYKADAGKPNPLLLETGCPRALLAVIQVLDFGAIKYEPHSWQHVEVDRYNAAARRHRIARDMGEDRDPESGLLHLAHETANLLFQLEMKCLQYG
ncbi:dATP/dGTP diphosphohydrolase domain-containing protein [Pseudophaeobacter sp.]|uniref:dATP/dGTP diphosphohydrolase domain-containing protein n=1 Tax=Pseudophaeobacter sp. TaxID=1971739 RepID=UPI002627B18A|nr:dATP/dGTP diphosphohydrolase domain-containing protein [Pseudophaeobacter sp.]